MLGGIPRALWKALPTLVFLTPVSVTAQDRVISGTVTAALDGRPLPAVSVLVVETRQGAITDRQGNFRVAGVPSGPVTLRFSVIGYRTREVRLEPGQTSVGVSLDEDVLNLDAIVVTGQATTLERRSATTSIAYVAGEDLNRVPAPTVLNALTGKITGVNLQTNSGAPGGGIQIQVRGNSTILGAFDPLVVVDGVIYSNASIPGPRGFVNAAASPTLEADPVNRIADLNPADIASIEVLKGAAASSIYGSKASNGVIVITTVRGQAGTPRVNLTQRIGLSTPLRSLPERCWTEQEAVARYGEVARPFFQGLPAPPCFDHYAQVFHNRKPSYETLADLRGGTESTRYFVSGGWKHEEGIEPATFADLQTLRANIDQILSPTTELKISTGFSRSANNRGWNNNCNNYGCHGYAIAYIPSFVDLTKRNADGSFPTPTVGPQSNPLQLIELAENLEETLRFTGGITFRWDLFDRSRQSLRLVAGGGLDAFDQNNRVWSPNDLFFERVQALPGESLRNTARSLFYNWNLNAIHSFTGSFFTANTSVGLQYEDRKIHTYLIRTQNLLPGQRNVNQGTNVSTTENLEQERTVAVYVQEALGLLSDRLLLLGGLRAERSSVNGDTRKYYIFPKISASYRLANWIGEESEIKIRAAYGETGNQPRFGQKFTNLSTPQLGGQQGVTVSTAAGSPTVEPERLKEIELGVDGVALHSRLTWELTWFTRNTTNLLLQRVPAPSTGYATQIFNGGKIRNDGIEAAVGYAAVRHRTGQWVSRATFTRYTSEVVDLAGLPPFFPPQSGFGNLGRTYIQVGKPITQIVAFDFDKEGKRTPTLVQVGNSAPDFRMGFVNDVNWKGWSFNWVVDWQQGGSVINLTQYLYDHAGTSHDYGKPSWEKRNGARLAGVASVYVEDATFVKLREASLQWEVPAPLYQSLGLGLRSLRMGVQGRNLHMWTRYSGLDPEVANFGPAAIRNNLDISPYPPSRSFYFNVMVGF